MAMSIGAEMLPALIAARGIGTARASQANKTADSGTINYGALSLGDAPAATQQPAAGVQPQAPAVPTFSNTSIQSSTTPPRTSPAWSGAKAWDSTWDVPRARLEPGYKPYDWSPFPQEVRQFYDPGYQVPPDSIDRSGTGFEILPNGIPGDPYAYFKANKLPGDRGVPQMVKAGDQQGVLVAIGPDGKGVFGDPARAFTAEGTIRPGYTLLTGNTPVSAWDNLGLTDFARSLNLLSPEQADTLGSTGDGVNMLDVLTELSQSEQQMLLTMGLNGILGGTYRDNSGYDPSFMAAMLSAINNSSSKDRDFMFSQALNQQPALTAVPLG